MINHQNRKMKKSNNEEKGWTLELLNSISIENFLKNLFLDSSSFNSERFMFKVKVGNTCIPAGYTYLGQFIAHDLSFDASTQTDLKSKAKRNFRTPTFDLDSIYGKGTISNPIYYDQTQNRGRTHFIIDEFDFSLNHQFFIVKDIQRKNHGYNILVPIIPDFRNDENIAVSQLHLAVQLFHNRAIDFEESKKNEITSLRFKEPKQQNTDTSWHGNFHQMGTNESLNQRITSSEQQKESSDPIQLEKITEYDKRFYEVRKKVKQHYHWIIVNDFLPKIVGKKIVENILNIDKEKHNFKYYCINEKSYIPDEFSVAAFRFGHSMVRERYKFSPFVRDSALFEIKKTFNRPNGLLQWDFFFFEPNTFSEGNNSFKINPFLDKHMLGELPETGNQNIAYRNLERSRKKKLISGQDLAGKMKDNEIQIEKILDYDYAKSKSPAVIDELEEQFIKKLSKYGDKYGSISQIRELFVDFCNNSPLWFYILLEAAVEEKGEKLGSVGGRIVAEVILGILVKDDDFFLKYKEWKPDYFITVFDATLKKELPKRVKKIIVDSVKSIVQDKTTTTLIEETLEKMNDDFTALSNDIKHLFTLSDKKFKEQKKEIINETEVILTKTIDDLFKDNISEGEFAKAQLKKTKKDISKVLSKARKKQKSFQSREILKKGDNSMIEFLQFAGVYKGAFVKKEQA